jgi:hypothetical protein
LWWQQSNAFYRRSGYLVHLDFAGRALSRFALTPYVLNPSGVQLMVEPMRQAFLQDLAQVSDVLRRPRDVLAAWDAFIDDNGGPLAYWRAVVPNVDGLADAPIEHGVRLMNMLATPAHHQLMIRCLQRLMAADPTPVPDWAHELVERWRTLDYDQVCAEAQKG